jgi:zinc protease
MRTNDRLRKIGISLLSLAFLMLTAVGTVGQAAPTTAKADKDNAKEKPMFDYQEITLDNGLKVVTLEDFSCPIVATQIWYHVGSKNENPERQGFAHMFEHMMFRGTDRLGPTDHFGLIRSVGGSTNGYTSFDRTVYLETLPADQLELALWLEAERMSFLKIDQDAFNTERKVVEEERRNGLNSPYGSVVEKLLAELYKVHPYSWPPIGKIAHLEASTVQELRDFWQRYYVPNNATLVIVGAVKHEDAQKLAKQYFGWIPRYDDPPKVAIEEPRPTEKRSVTIKDAKAPAPAVGMVWRTVPVSDKDTAALDLLSEILGGGNSSRLYRELVAQKQLAVMAQTIHWSLEQDGIFGAGAVLSPIGGKADAVLEIIGKQIERARTEPITEKELTKAKNQMLRSLVTQNLEIESKASMLGTAALDYGDVSEVNRQFDEVKKVTADDILRVAKKYLAPQQAMEVKVEQDMIGAVMGSGKSETTTTAPVEKTAPKPGRPGLTSRSEDFPKEPPLAKISTTKLTPKFTRKTLPNGLKVMVVPNHEVPFVSVQLGLLAGSWTDEKPGAAAMAMSLLTKGTDKHTEAELAEELETYAITLAGGGDMDTASLSMSCLTEQIERGMKFLGEVALSPSFPESEFNKLRKQVLTGLAVSSVEPEYIADREYRHRLYGEHPYSRTATGEVADVENLKVGDMKAWYETYARPDMAVLIIAGDIDEITAFTLAEKTFSGWKAEGAKPENTLPQLKQPDKTHIYLVDQPGNIQSQIRVGQLGITRKDNRYYVSRLVSSYFGWDFNSRLNRSIRVAKGLTYSVWGSYIAQNFAGDFRVGTFSKTASTAQTVQAVLDEIRQLKLQSPTDKELQNSQSYMLGSFVGRRETPQQIAGDLWLIESQNLGDDYLERLLDGIAGATSDDCQKLVDSTIDPDKMVIVVVGEADKLKADLEKIAPVTVIPAAKK